MFDLTSSKLLILAIVALLVVGPKDFPVLLRTVGRYLGILRKHATEFRTQFDDAIREAELDQMREQVEKMSRDIEKSVRDADAKLASEFDDVGREANEALSIPPKRPDRVVMSDHPAPSQDAQSEPALSEPGGAAAQPGVDAAAHAEPAQHTGPPPSAQPAHAPLPRPGALAGGPPSVAVAKASPDTIAPGPAEPALASDKRSA